MKLVWSPETASKAYIDTVKFVSNVFVLDRSSDEMLFNSIGFFFFFFFSVLMRSIWYWVLFAV
jgi:hypothetical protein